MKLVAMTVLLALSTSSAFAIQSPKYPKANLAMTCGDVEIVNLTYTTSMRGQLFQENMDLGPQVTAIQGDAGVELVQTAGPEKTLFGRKKGFGLFEGGNLRLDLRNTTEGGQIYLENVKTGQKAVCRVHGDCC